MWGDTKRWASPVVTAEYLTSYQHEGDVGDVGDVSTILKSQWKIISLLPSPLQIHCVKFFSSPKGCLGELITHITYDGVSYVFTNGCVR